MLYVSLALAAALVVTVLAGAGLIRSLIRSHARDRDLLVNQLCSLAGKPWQPAPANDRPFRQPDPDREPALIGSPEQWPDE